MVGAKAVQTKAIGRRFSVAVYAQPLRDAVPTPAPPKLNTYRGMTPPGSVNREVKVTDACVGCAQCLPRCPRGAISVLGRCELSPECNDCGACAKWCPVGALAGGGRGRR